MGNFGALVRHPSLDVSAEAADGDYRMIWGRRCFFGYTVAPDGEIWWFANPPSRTELTPDQLRGTGADVQKARLVELLSADEGPAAEIVAATPGPILAGNQHELARVPRWQRDGMALVGDAAHAVSPATGQGVALACEDAVVLAQSLRDHADITSGLAAYERARRARADRVMAWGKRLGTTKTAGPLGRLVRDLALPYFLAKAATPAALEKQAWLFSHHLEWEPGHGELALHRHTDPSRANPR
jgi:2-polyprenyl-6-methoxyphenol hydroxylase-like FAD-dependent oxidoreductase